LRNQHHQTAFDEQQRHLHRIDPKRPRYCKRQGYLERAKPEVGEQV